MKLNVNKCHLMIFGKKSETVKIHVGEAVMVESDEETLLGITLDTKLSFKTHVQSLCRKARKKLHALSIISIFMGSKTIKLTMNTFVLSQFSYCPLIWMFHDRKIDNKINKTQERALRIAYRGSTSQCKEFLEKDNLVSIQQKTLELLLIEIYKTKNQLNLSFMI